MACSSLFSHLLLLSLLHAVLLTLSYAQANDQVRLGSSLTAQIDPINAWLSPSGEFSFGFRPLETDSSLFLLAVWFSQLADRTVVWYANRELPVLQAGSKVELTEDGKLNLTNHDGQAVWNASNFSDASYAAMLDAGNFVIMGADNAVRWQTFDDPSDTILPSQVLGPVHNLRSRLSETDYSYGQIELIIQNDGNLVFYKKGFPYWRTNTVGARLQLVFNESGSIYFTLNGGNLVNFTSASNYSTRDFYQMARLDDHGYFRQYVRPKNGTADKGWTQVDFQPDICGIKNDCGKNSYCKSTGNDSYTCVCLPGYFLTDPNKPTQGCWQDSTKQSCSADEVELEAPFNISHLLHVDWPGGGVANETENVDQGQCRDSCLRDCDCQVAIYQNSTRTCWTKKLPVSNGRMGLDVDRTALVKVPSGTSKSASNKKTLKVIIIVLVLGFLLLASIATGLCLWKKNKKQVPVLGIRNPSIFGESKGEELELPLFDLFTIESATNNFSINNKLGEGGFGPVYKGQLEDGQEIAVKRLAKDSVQGLNEFKNEVILIAKLQHRNLVRLLGCCIQREERLLIYEYMQNKSLDFFIFGLILFSFYFIILCPFNHATLIAYLIKSIVVCSLALIYNIIEYTG